jgi:hypothetical protein
MPAPGAGGVQTSLVGTVQGMMARARPRSAASRDPREARRLKAQAATRRT